MKLNRRRLPQSGFTIIELMIATAVFAVVLLLLVFSIVQISHAFFKGLVSSRTQDVVRTVSDDIGQTLQFNKAIFRELPANGTGTGAVKGYCINNTIYSYILGKQLTSGSNNRFVARDAPVTDGCTSPTARVMSQAQMDSGVLPASEHAKELLGNNMRLVNFEIKRIDDTDLYKIKIRVAYGDDDLLESPGPPGSPADPNGYDEPDARCKTQTGSHFCTVSEIATTVQMRIE